MGKIFARFRNPYVAEQSQQAHSPAAPPHSQIVSSHKIETNKQETTTMKLREINNYAEYQNVLCTESASNSLCLFGIDDFVRKIIILLLF